MFYFWDYGIRMLIVGFLEIYRGNLNFKAMVSIVRSLRVIRIFNGISSWNTFEIWTIWKTDIHWDSE